MMESADGLMVRIGADTSQYEKELKKASELGQQFGRTVTRAFVDAALSGRKLKDVFHSLMLSLSQMALKSALKPIEDAVGSIFGSVFSGATKVILGGGAKSSLVKFAKGGITGGPLAFPAGNGRIGLAGESGAEAILPLTRGRDGKLGVRSDATTRAVTINFNVTTADAESFRRSESQISAMLNRAVMRGNRNL